MNTSVHYENLFEELVVNLFMNLKIDIPQNHKYRRKLEGASKWKVSDSTKKEIYTKRMSYYDNETIRMIIVLKR